MVEIMLCGIQLRDSPLQVDAGPIRHPAPYPRLWPVNRKGSHVKRYTFPEFRHIAPAKSSSTKWIRLATALPRYD
jgi:hypothetical protein